MLTKNRTFKMVSAGNFEVTEGHAGYSIDADAIKEQVKTALMKFPQRL